jgi:hypothetical protein
MVMPMLSARCALRLIRREHGALDLEVRDARVALGAFGEDGQALTTYMHAAKAAREDAEVALEAARKAKEAVRADWGAKLRDRRKEARAHALAILAIESQIWHFLRLPLQMEYLLAMHACITLSLVRTASRMCDDIAQTCRVMRCCA